MRLLKHLPGFLFFLLCLLVFFNQSAFAACEVRNYDNPEEYQRAIEACQKEINSRMGAHSKNKQDLENLKKSVANTQQLIESAETQINQIENRIAAEEQSLSSQETLLATRVRHYYIKSRRYSPLLIFLATDNATELFRELSYRKLATDEDKDAILATARQIRELAENKQEAENNRAWLSQTKSGIESQVKALGEEVSKVEGYFTEVSGKIAQLSARQQALLSARSGTFTSSVGEVPISTIPCSGPPGSPSYCNPGGGNWFAAFSFGAWTHRKGMSQYGAKGRADAGQSVNDILQAYYGKTPAGLDTGGTISVQGYGDLNFEDYYLMGIAEMPSSWHPEALKAQAIAARSYAYRYKVEGRSICTTQACQVFSQSKANAPPEAWRAAVQATRGQVIEGVTTFYSSTSGGYLTTSGWDTTDSQGGPGFASRAWESKAGSPWFYSSWYTSSYTAGSANCGRAHPWLNEEEMADILNAWLVLNQQGNDERILPITINQCGIDGGGGNPYSMAELRNKANSLGGAFTSVSSASVTYSNSGETSTVSLSTNKGSVNVSGSEFKQAFNLRAPGYIAIRSPLFNLEKK
jgi:peptidoglycan hydrolase-like amidase